MRNTRALIMIVFSLIAGIAAVALASRWLNSQNTFATNRIVVAAQDISAGQTLNTQIVRTIEWPLGSTPSGAFTSIDELNERVAKVNITRDEPILSTKLAPVGTRGGMSAIIKEGKRAMSVRVDEVVGVAGFALPGSYVDVMVSTRAGSDRNAPPVSKIVLEKILVLAIAQQVSRDETTPQVVRAVTLEVTPDEAEMLDIARNVGTLSLVLRNQVDDAAASTEGATQADLLGIKPVADKPAPARKVVRRAARPQKTCVDAWDGTKNRSECF